jgi:fumarate reductase flavoprotein subunit
VEVVLMPADIDVLVVGAGACGLAAAIAAHDAGAGVAVIEKLDRPGGNSSLSTGSVPAAGTRFQRAAGIADSPERFIDDLVRTGGPTDCPQLLRRLAESSAATVEWLVDSAGARISLVTAYKHVGHSVPRLHAPVSRRGQDLVDDLLAAVEQRGIPLAVGNGATALVADADGGVIGADVKTTNGEGHRIIARKIVLAVNGFAGNRDLVARFCPEISGAPYFGARGSTGEAVLWGEQLGAALGNIGAYQGYAAVADPHGSLLSWTTIEKGGIIVNGAGRRFGDESAGYSGYTPNVMGQGAACFAIFDQRIFDVAALEEEFVELANYGGIKQADTPAALADRHGLDPAALASTVETYNNAARGDAPDAFGRRDFALAPLSGALHICRVVPGLFHTQGGLMVDDDGRVLRPNGRPIANLFAGGGAAAGLSGRAGAGGYASGNGLLSAIGLGRLAGLAAAAEIGNVIARSEATKQSRAARSAPGLLRHCVPRNDG